MPRACVAFGIICTYREAGVHKIADTGDQNTRGGARGGTVHVLIGQMSKRELGVHEDPRHVFVYGGLRMLRQVVSERGVEDAKTAYQ